MSTTVRSLEEIQSLFDAQNAPVAEAAQAPSPSPENAKETTPLVKKEPQRDSFGRAYATGKRKRSIARVWVKPGTGQIVVNEKPLTTYFARPILRMILQRPLLVAQRQTQLDVICVVQGGGLSGQAGAVRHGIAKALEAYDPELRLILKPEGFLTRDSRVPERKKYGRRKARRRFQFSKR